MVQKVRNRGTVTFVVQLVNAAGSTDYLQLNPGAAETLDEGVRVVGEIPAACHIIDSKVVEPVQVAEPLVPDAVAETTVEVAQPQHRGGKGDRERGGR